MTLRSARLLLSLMALGSSAWLATGIGAQAEEIDTLPSAITFVTSTGYWEDTPDSAPAGQTPREGYYKLVSVRQTDRTAKVFLQQIASDSQKGPSVVSSVEIEELTKMKPFVTDIRPESSAGPANQPGLFATVYLKTDAAAKDVESWTVMIDELGEMIVERASN